MPPLLSICIGTYNRAGFLAETLDSIVQQIRDDVEVIIVDGASPDNTIEVVTPYLKEYPQIRYYRELTNSGVDGDYDKAVSYAAGDYCWLMPDDDLLMHDAIFRVLQSLDESSPDLVVVNSECWNADFSINLHTNMLNIKSDREYAVENNDLALIELASCLSYIGSVVIKRSKWLERDRISYYGSLFVHVGVIYQHPPLKLIKALTQPVIKIRYGNAMWTPRSFEIWYFKWPKLIWSFVDFTDELKSKVVPLKPWRSSLKLFKSRAKGEYSHSEFRKFLSAEPLSISIAIAWAVSIFPAKVANFLGVIYYSLRMKSSLYALFDLLRSRHASRFSRLVARFFGVRVL